MSALNPTHDPLELPDPVRWEPWKDKDQPHVFRGHVIKKYQQYSDYREELCNFVDVLNEGGAQHVWTLSGFATRVHTELERVNPNVGHRIGVKYLGLKERKRDKKQYPDLAIVNYTQPPASVDFRQPSEPEAADTRESFGDLPSEFTDPPDTAVEDGPDDERAEEVGDDDLPF